MKKLIAIIMVIVLCAVLCACGNEDSKSEPTGAPTQAQKETKQLDVVKETTQQQEETKKLEIEEETKKLEIETQKPTQPPTQKPTQAKKEPSAKDLVIADVTGMWYHDEYGVNDTINITKQSGNTLHMTICSVRGNGIQIAESEVVVTVAVDAAGGVGLDSDNLGGKGTFKYQDTFGNSGSGEILVNKNSITLSIYQTYDAGMGWGITVASGNYSKG